MVEGVGGGGQRGKNVLESQCKSRRSSTLNQAKDKEADAPPPTCRD